MAAETTDTKATDASQQSALRTINFDTVTCGRVSVTKGGKTWRLRDDIPSEIMLRMFIANSLQSLQARIAERFEMESKREHPEDENTRLAMREAAQDEIMAAQLDTFDILTDIFRHSYPEMTVDIIAGTYNRAKWRWEGGLFSLDEAQQLCNAFFTLRSVASTPPPSASPTAAPQEQMNGRHLTRAERRRSRTAAGTSPAVTS